MLYTFREMGQGNYEVAKFDDRKRPIEVYDIYGGHCNCPSPKVLCKHIIMLNDWKKQESRAGLAFDSDLKLFIRFVDPEGLHNLLKGIFNE